MPEIKEIHYVKLWRFLPLWKKRSKINTRTKLKEIATLKLSIQTKQRRLVPSRYLCDFRASGDWIPVIRGTRGGMGRKAT